MLNWDLPPVASQRYWGIRAAQMMAVFSDSTRATVLLGCWGRRCFSKRHWVSCQSLGSCVDLGFQKLFGEFFSCVFQLKYGALYLSKVAVDLAVCAAFGVGASFAYAF